MPLNSIIISSFVSDPHIQESTTIQLQPVECQRADGTKFTFFKGEFDIIMAPNSSQVEN